MKNSNFVFEVFATVCLCMSVLVTQNCQLCVGLMDSGPPRASLSAVPQAKYWVGLLFPPPGIFSILGSNPGFQLQADSFLSEPDYR